tara:strand:+ start:1613 stop:2173 length:561 start_codon:yes stop_codon:yes gene_type:complete
MYYKGCQMNIKLNIVVFLAVLNASGLKAAPTPNISYLMGEPATLFDIGLLRLDEEMKKVRVKNISDLHFYTTYDWKENRIKLKAITLGSEANNTDEAKDWCRSTINYARQMLLINFETGKPFYGGSSKLVELFSHVDFGRGNKPEGIGAELDGITIISASFSAKSGNTRSVNCEAPLLGNKVFFQE